MRPAFLLFALAAVVTNGCARSDLGPSLPSAEFGSTKAISTRPAASGYHTIYSFAGAPDGAQPEAGLLSVNGVLVGTTYAGGKTSGCNNGAGCGTVFRVHPSGVERILHRFNGNPDGANPLAGLAAAGGVFFGTTFGGGGAGLGTVFSVNPFGSERVVYSFTGAPDGALPEATLLALHGRLYGTTYGGGVQGCLGSPTGCGTAFSVTESGNETVIHRFGVRPDGSLPISSLLYDHGTFYGTTTKRTTNEGGDACGAGLGCGVVFKMNAAGDESVLYRFLKRPDASNPTSGLTAFNGLFYGTTPYGGAAGKGTVYLVNASGGELVVHSFKGYGDGANPFAGLTAANGFVYGTTYGGGRHGKGTVFRVDPSGTKSVLHDFAGGSDGANPRGALARLNGVLYGTTQYGGAHGAGTVFAFTP